MMRVRLSSIYKTLYPDFRRNASGGVNKSRLTWPLDAAVVATLRRHCPERSRARSLSYSVRQRL
jgi:hypothetical protein